VSNNPTIREFDARRFESIEREARCGSPCCEGLRGKRESTGWSHSRRTASSFWARPPASAVSGRRVGFCAHGVAGSGGVGKALAEWIVGGEPPYDSLAHGHPPLRTPRREPKIRARALPRDLPPVLLDRVSGPGASKCSRSAEELGVRADARARGGFRRESGVGAAELVHAQRGARERSRMARPRGWARRLWSPAIGAEHEAVRERVGLFDATSFSKIELAGLGALEFLERLSTNSHGAAGRIGHLHPDVERARAASSATLP
jgi:4-methylaminobutanoate oxidase (formaldehyde-forming)